MVSNSLTEYNFEKLHQDRSSIHEDIYNLETELEIL